jgi:hexosaminidase
MVDWYLSKVFGCTPNSPSTGNSKLTISIKDGVVLLPTDTTHERYSLTLNNAHSWELSADYYPGFLRGLETFSQLFTKDEQGKWEVSGLPIQVTDGPQFIWRGLMIDSSRHFLPMETIRHAIDSMMYSKLNILHWHIIDEDSFPMQVPSVPELSEFGSVGGLISPEDIRGIIDYAK